LAAEGACLDTAIQRAMGRQRSGAGLHPQEQSFSQRRPRGCVTLIVLLYKASDQAHDTILVCLRWGTVCVRL